MVQYHQEDKKATDRQWISLINKKTIIIIIIIRTRILATHEK